MHVAVRRYASWVLAGAAACALVTCGRDAMRPVRPAREAPPMGPRPAPPSGPVGTTPTAGEAGDSPIYMPPCGEDKRCRLDGGHMDPGVTAPAERPPSSQLDLPRAPVAQLDRVAERASVAPKQPVLDAGADGGAPLPPVPDAGPPIIRDAGQPMR
jgi:hypothetical protein